MLAVFQLDKRGGKERDCLATARFLASRGHEVSVLTTTASADVAVPLRLVKLPARGWSNHGRARAFAQAVMRHRAAAKPDVLLAFERIPGADFVFVADATITGKYHGFWSSLPRRRAMLALERAAFEATPPIKAFFLTASQRDAYRAAYRFDPAQAIVLPLILHEERYAAIARVADRRDIRQQLGVPADKIVAVSLAVQPWQKGFDRTLEALPARPDLHLLLAGSSEPWMQKKIDALNLKARVRVLPYTADVMGLMAAADIFVHPARAEAGGIVIAEALLAGTPAIVSGICGYSAAVARSGAGIVLPEPFRHDALSKAISDMIERLPEYRRAAAAEAERQRRMRGEWLTVIAEQLEEYVLNRGGQRSAAV